MVVPEARRQGIGRALMLAAEQWTRERGVTSVELIVWDFNREALQLYEQLGYSVEFRRLRRVL
jgi:ribosomal protein S18 acetylase RimI-like enzyme